MELIEGKIYIYYSLFSNCIYILRYNGQSLRDTRFYKFSVITRNGYNPKGVDNGFAIESKDFIRLFEIGDFVNATRDW